MNIKKIIREEVDDFDWINDVPTNPWLVYDVVIIDVKLRNEEINNLIELALNSGRNIDNATDWEENREDDLGRIQSYYLSGGSYLRIDKSGGLFYGSKFDLSRYDTNRILCSQLFKNKRI